MEVYVLLEFIDSHNSGAETNVIGVYDSVKKVRAKIANMLKEIKKDPCFFMADIFDDDEFDEDIDRRDETKDGISLYCSGNGDQYDLSYTKRNLE